jgi:MinD superfamily P-loop ATPase
MKQLLILSGKGGTGKTTIAGAFIKLARAQVFADCDVDAPNLHLILSQATRARRSDYYGLPKAVIDEGACVECDLCRENCRYAAISGEGGRYKVDPFACEGCGVCAELCPVDAIALEPAVVGELMLYTGDTIFSTAELKMGSGTSGKLVTEVKKQMTSAAVKADLAIIDGSPGIGCPVIASLSGVDMVLIVAEPSISGISDMERIIQAAAKFQVKMAVCVNKYDTNLKNTERIESFCQNLNLPFVGKIPFDAAAVKAINNGLSIVEVGCRAGEAVKEVFNRSLPLLFDDS